MKKTTDTNCYTPAQGRAFSQAILETVNTNFEPTFAPKQEFMGDGIKIAIKLAEKHKLQLYPNAIETFHTMWYLDDYGTVHVVLNFYSKNENKRTCLMAHVWQITSDEINVEYGTFPSIHRQ